MVRRKRGLLAIPIFTDLISHVIGRLNLTHPETGSLDAAMLLLASIIITRPGLSNYKFHISTALWLNYRNVKDLQIKDIPGDLVQWFLFMVFGNHATKREVDAWLGNKQVARWVDSFCEVIWYKLVALIQGSATLVSMLISVRAVKQSFLLPYIHVAHFDCFHQCFVVIVRWFFRSHF